MPLSPAAPWPPTLRMAADIVLAMRFPACLVWGRDLACLPNEAFQTVLGAGTEALGRPLDEMLGEAWERIAPLARRALAGEAALAEDVPLMLRRDGTRQEAFFALCCSPIRDETGAVAGFLNTMVETTAKVLAERRQAFLLQLEERLRGLQDPQDAAFAAAEALGRHLGAARAGHGEVDAAGATVRVERDWTDGRAASLAGEARILDAFGPALIAELRAGRTLVVEDCLTDSRSAGEAHAVTWASIGVRSLIVVPLVRGGRLTAVLYLHEASPRRWQEPEIRLAEEVAHRSWSAVERARAENALREAELRYRTLFDAAPFGVLVLDPVTHAILDVNEHACSELGYTREEMLRLSIRDIDTLGDSDALRRRGREHALRPGTQEFEAQHRRRNGEIRDMLVRVQGVRLGGQDVSYGAHFDITDRKRAEARQALLMRELDHRARNILAVVQATLRLTAKADPQALITAVEGRVQALARAHTLLAEGRWEGADFQTILRGELDPFLAGQRAELSGPPVVLNAAQAQALAMAVHELATNAAKHGALSAATGRVNVSWEVREQVQHPILRLLWKERGGPPIAGTPVRRGFGSRLLDGTIRGQLGGSLCLHWDTGGLTCEIEVPLQERGAAEWTGSPASGRLD